MDVKKYNNPDAVFYCFMKQAQLLNLKYIKHYELLERYIYTGHGKPNLSSYRECIIHFSNLNRLR